MYSNNFLLTMIAFNYYMYISLFLNNRSWHFTNNQIGKEMAELGNGQWATPFNSRLLINKPYFKVCGQSKKTTTLQNDLGVPNPRVHIFHFRLLKFINYKLSTRDHKPRIIQVVDSIFFFIRG